MVLDLRVYRAAFIPAVVMVLVAAFSLAGRPEPVRAPVGSVLFDVDRAFGAERNPSASSLRELASAFPSRRPGSAGDAALAARVGTELEREGFQVSRSAREASTPDGRRDLVSVRGLRPGASPRRVAVVAARDALGSPAPAALSATAGLIEIARQARTRDLRHTLELVSVSGGSIGGAGLRAWAREEARRGGIDAVLVLGDLASRDGRRPWVVPWSNDGAPAPVALLRTVEVAVRRETDAEPGGARAPAQWVRRALPATIGLQGEAGAAGLPAVMLSASGERPPDPRAAVTRTRMAEFGRAAMRSLAALDSAGGPRPFEREVDGVVTLRRVLPNWTARTLVLLWLLPAFVTAFDAYFRVRRRGQPTEAWLAWAAAGALPVLAAWALTRALGALGAVAAPAGPAPGGAFPLTAGAAVALATACALVLAGPVVAQRLAGRAAGLAARSRSTGGAGAAAALLAAGTALATWVPNPYAAALLLPAAHLWLLAAAPETRWRGALTAGALAGGAALPVAAALHYRGAFDMSLPDLVWTAFLAAAGGQTGPLAALAAAALIAALAATVAAARARLRRLGAREMAGV